MSLQTQIKAATEKSEAYKSLAEELSFQLVCDKDFNVWLNAIFVAIKRDIEAHGGGQSKNLAELGQYLTDSQSSTLDCAIGDSNRAFEAVEGDQ